jgi:hypothetical protein
LKAIVITTINKPTKAVIDFSQKEGYKIIVVGDRKTPSDFFCQNVDYLSIDRQFKFNNLFADLLPYNHYCRKNIGYLYAVKNGAKVIIDTDDDNIPYENWAFPDFHGIQEIIKGFEGFLNVYSLFTDQKIWPRGYPLNKINETAPDFRIEIENSKAGIWQGLADEDPDVDAVYRLTINKNCYFNKRKPILLDKNILCPINSQNTAILKELFPLLYLPSTVTFRYTDILRGLIAQPIMWLYDYKLGFTEATVIQKRNEHDYMKDFESEIPVYMTAEKVVKIVSGNISSRYSIGENLFSSYEALVREKIVGQHELNILTAWLREIGS